MSNKSWREQLTEMGGYENAFVAINAGTVREIIQELEECRVENHTLIRRVVGLEQAVQEYERKMPLNWDSRKTFDR